MKRSIRLGNALVACCLLLGAANVAQAAPLVTGETLPRYCVSNVRSVEGPVKGNVVEHHGLGCIGKRELDYSTLCEADVRAFGATGNGETDDSAAIQRALDDERRPLIVRIPAGAYRIARTLRVRGGTTILADPRARLFMCDRTPHRAGDHLLTNAGSDGTGGRDRDIAICGGIWDGNNRRGTNVKPADIFEKGGWSGALLNFRNVDGLVLDGLECANSVTYNIRMCEIDGFAISNIRFSSRERGWNQDGVHMNGFCFNGLIADVRAVTRGQTADDLLAFNADDSMARIENLGMVCGPITNVLCRNIFAEDCHSAIRFLSVVSPIRDVRIENITVGCRCYAVNADAARYCRTPLFKDGDRPKGVGLIENVTVSNFVFHATSDADMPLLCLETNCRNVTFEGLRRDAALDAAPKRPFARLRKMDDLRYSSDGAVSSLPCGEVRELPSSPTTLRLGL